MQHTVLSGPPDSQKAFCDGRVSTHSPESAFQQPEGVGLCLSYHAPGGDGLGRVALQVDGGIAACARGVGGGVGPLLDAAEHLIAQALHGLHLGRGRRATGLQRRGSMTSWERGWGAQRADVAIRRLFESGFAKAPSEADVPAPRDGMLTRSGCGGRRQLVAAMAFSFKGRRREEEGVSQQRRKQKRIETEERGKREAKRRSCSAVVMIKRGGGWLLRTIIQSRQAGSNRLGVLGDSNYVWWEGSLGSAKSRQCLGLGSDSVFG